MENQVQEAIAKIRELEEVEGRTFDGLMAAFYAAKEAETVGMGIAREPWVNTGFLYLMHFLPNHWAKIIDIPRDYSISSAVQSYDQKKIAARQILQMLGVVELDPKKHKHLYSNYKYHVEDVLETKSHLFDTASKKYSQGNFGAMHEIDAILKNKFNESEGLPNLPPLHVPTNDDSSKISHNALLRLVKAHPLLFTRHFNAELLKAGHAMPLDWTAIDREIKKVLT